MTAQTSDPSQTAQIDDDAPQRPSKTQRKNEAHALTDLGRRLVDLKSSQLARIPLSTAVAEAVNEARAMHSHGARKRQLLYLGKLLRREETEGIQAALEQLLAPGRKEAARVKQAERWRERLLAEGDNALSELLAQYLQADRQQLRQLLRQYAQLGPEHPRGKQAARALYRLLHQLLGNDTNA